MANCLLNYLWQIAVWSAPHAIKFWSGVTCMYIFYIRIATISSSECEMTAYTFGIDSMIQGHHEYQSIWDNPVADGDLLCE